MRPECLGGSILLSILILLVIIFLTVILLFTSLRFPSARAWPGHFATRTQSTRAPICSKTLRCDHPA